MIRLLLLTGARRGEVLGMRWADLDLAAGTWVKPGSETKQKREHRVPLSAPVRQLLTEIRDQQPKTLPEYVFPGRGRLSISRGSRSPGRRSATGRHQGPPRPRPAPQLRQSARLRWREPAPDRSPVRALESSHDGTIRTFIRRSATRRCRTRGRHYHRGSRSPSGGACSKGSADEVPAASATDH